MNRWMREHRELRDTELDLGEGNGGESTTPSDPNPETTEEGTSSPTDTGAETPFGEGPLKGKSLAELEAEFAVMDTTIREQGTQLSEQHVKLSQPAGDEGGGGVQTSIPEISSEDFYADPAKVIREVVSSTVKEHLDIIIAPFKDSMVRDEAASAWTEAVIRYPDIAEKRTLIQAVFDKGGLRDPNVESIVHIYKSVLGDLMLSGQGVSPSTPALVPATPPTPPPPQHRASGQPMVDHTVSAPLRELTENEHVMRRMRNQSVEEYLAWQNLDEEDVIESKIGVAE